MYAGHRGNRVAALQGGAARSAGPRLLVQPVLRELVRRNWCHKGAAQRRGELDLFRDTCTALSARVATGRSAIQSSQETATALETILSLALSPEASSSSVCRLAV